MNFSLDRIKSVAKDAAAVVDKNSPAILTGLAVAGFVTTIVLACKATPKAKEILENAREDLDTPDITEEQEKEVKVEAAKELAKTVAPAVIFGVATTACIIGANTVNTKRIAALSAAYKLSETALTNYKDEAKKLLGDKKEERVREAVAQKTVSDNPPNYANVIETGLGDILCYDMYTAKYYKSKPASIDKAVNDFNAQLMQEDYMSLNDLHEKMGLPYSTLGDEFGWHVEDGLVEVVYTSTLTPDNVPALVPEFSPRPNWRFDKSEYHR